MMFFSVCAYLFFYTLFRAILATKGKCVGYCTGSFDPQNGLQLCTDAQGPCLGCIGQECSPNNEKFFQEPEKEEDYMDQYVALYCDSTDTEAVEAIKTCFSSCNKLILPQQDLTTVTDPSFYWNYDAYSICALSTAISLDARKAFPDEYDPDLLDRTVESPCIEEINRCKQGPPPSPFENPITSVTTAAAVCMAGLALVIYCRFRPREEKVDNLPVIDHPADRTPVAAVVGMQV